MHRFPNTAARLAAWRSYAAKAAQSYRDRGAPVPDEYEPGRLPGRWFGQLSPPTVTRDERGARLHYGDGIGGDIVRSRPAFRFVGYADECIRLGHTGWYGDAAGEGFNTWRGVVFQLPAKDGAERFLAGAEWGDSSGRTFDVGGGFLDIDGAGCIYESKEDAAHAAESIAQNTAEADREEDERFRAEEAEREEAEEAERERLEAEHAERVAERLEATLRLAGEVCNAMGDPAVNDSAHPDLRDLIGQLEVALHEYDAEAAAEPAESAN